MNWLAFCLAWLDYCL